VTYSVSLSDQRERKAKREAERKEEMEKYKEKEAEMATRRRHKETLQRSRTEARWKEEEASAEKRRTRRGLHRVDTFGSVHRKKVIEDDDTNVKYGMDGELEEAVRNSFGSLVEIFSDQLAL